MKKKSEYIFFIFITLVSAGFFLFLLFYISTPAKKPTVAPPTLPLAKISKQDVTGKKITFPAYSIVITFPSNLKTLREINPHSEDTQIGANFIGFYSSDAVIDTTTNQQTKGTFLAVNIVNTKSAFSPPDSFQQTKLTAHMQNDTTIIPTDNPLLSVSTVRAYAFPYNQDLGNSLYNTEVLITPNNKTIDINIHCVVFAEDASTCQALVKQILPTIQTVK